MKQTVRIDSIQELSPSFSGDIHCPIHGGNLFKIYLSLDLRHIQIKCPECEKEPDTETGGD